MAGETDTVSKRAKLAHRKNPYWQGVSGGRGGVSLGYRTAVRGAGSWVGKVVVDGKRIEERLAAADDDGAPPGALGYRGAVVAALEWGRRQVATIEARQELGAAATGPTVRAAVLTYSAERTKRSEINGRNAARRLSRHVLSDAAFADLPLAKLRASSVQAWRSRLTGEGDVIETTKPIAKATVNRLLNDLRAALNASAEAHRRELPPHLPAEIRIGTRAERVEAKARKQLLTDAMVRAAVEAAFEIEEDGHFGRLVMMAAATGARYSQLAALQVGHVQTAQARVLMPGSKKGTATAAKAPVAVPLSPDVLERLAPALHREPSAPLLTRWAYKSVGAVKWEKDRLRALGGAHEIAREWAAVVERAGLPAGSIMYSLRHTSIVRGLRAGLPVRLVASLHDTSMEMIEQHYSAFIVDMTEDLARRAMLSLGA